jgi:hypothetical protein
MSNLYSYLPSLFADSIGGGSSLLDTIYGIGTSAAGTTDPVQALQQADQNQTQDVQITARQPAVQVAINAFAQTVNGATSMTQLLANPSFMNVLLTANGMADQIGYTALATQALTSNLSDPNSLVNQLSDTRWQTLAQSYNFSAAGGLASFQAPATIAAIANQYATQVWETNQDQVTPGLSNALAFQVQASSITSVDQILGNPMMRTVVTTALGIPEQIAFQDLNAQEQAVSTQLGSVTQFQNPTFVSSFVQKYLIAAAAGNSTSSSSTDLSTLAAQAQGILV